MKDDRPSLTAVLVAYCVLILAGDDWGRARIPPGILEAQVAVLVAANLPLGTCPWILCNPLMAKLCRLGAVLFYPGFFEGIGFRKLIIECQVRDFLRQQPSKEKGKKAQVVVVAAGYDTLAVRLCREYGEADFWEVDHPATSRVKSRLWTTQGTNKTILGEKPSNMHHVQADLTKVHLDQALKQQTDYNPSLPTIVIVEGLSMYLTEQQMCGLLNDIACSMTAGGVVFDFFGWNEHKQEVDVGTLFPAMHRYGFTGAAEPWVWGLNPQKIHDFLADTHWELMADVQSCGFENVAALELVGKQMK